MTKENYRKEAKTAEQYLRARYGAYRGHYAWRELEEAFNAGTATEREACAKLCEESDRYRGEHFAQLIRARGQV